MRLAGVGARAEGLGDSPGHRNLFETGLVARELPCKRAVLGQQAADLVRVDKLRRLGLTERTGPLKAARYLSLVHPADRSRVNGCGRLGQGGDEVRQRALSAQQQVGEPAEHARRKAPSALDQGPVHGARRLGVSQGKRAGGLRRGRHAQTVCQLDYGVVGARGDDELGQLLRVPQHVAERSARAGHEAEGRREAVGGDGGVADEFGEVGHALGVIGEEGVEDAVAVELHRAHGGEPAVLGVGSRRLGGERDHGGVERMGAQQAHAIGGLGHWMHGKGARAERARA